MTRARQGHISNPHTYYANDAGRWARTLRLSVRIFNASGLPAYLALRDGWCSEVNSHSGGAISYDRRHKLTYKYVTRKSQINHTSKTSRHKVAHHIYGVASKVVNEYVHGYCQESKFLQVSRCNYEKINKFF